MSKEHSRFNPYKKPFIGSLGIHLLIFGLMFLNLDFIVHHSIAVDAQKAPEIVNAKIIDAGKVATEIAKLKANEAEKKHAEQLHQQQLALLARAAKQERQLEQQRLKEIQQQKQKMAEQLKAEQQAAAQKLAEMKAEAMAQQKKLIEQKAALHAQKLAAEAAIKKQIEQKVAREKALQVAAEEKATQEKAEAQKLAAQKAAEKLAAEKLAEKKAEALAAKKALQEQARAELEKQLQAQAKQEEAQMALVRTQQMQSVIDRYKNLILQSISQNWLVPPNTSKNSSVVVLIRLGAGGVVLNVSLAQSSGNSTLDNSAIAAVYKSSPLPVPSEADLFSQFQQLRLTLRPETVITMA